MQNLSGQRLGNYELRERLGRGGMAEVYQAYHSNMDRMVAVKIMLGHLADDSNFIERFKREAQAVGKLRHPHIIDIFDFGYEKDIYYMAMEYLKDGNLKEYIDTHKQLTVLDSVKIARDLADALAYAHQSGMIHRDLKPANIMFIDKANHEVVLTDFGIARILGAVGLTGTGMSVGTPAYMSPEAAAGGDTDARTDIYALGIILYEMLVGEAPYNADTPLAVIMKHINAPLPTRADYGDTIPEALEHIILRCIAKVPDDRFPTASDLRDALDKTLNTSEISSEKIVLTDTANITQALRRASSPDDTAPNNPTRHMTTIGQPSSSDEPEQETVISKSSLPLKPIMGVIIAILVIGGLGFFVFDEFSNSGEDMPTSSATPLSAIDTDVTEVAVNTNTDITPEATEAVVDTDTDITPEVTEIVVNTNTDITPEATEAVVDTNTDITPEVTEIAVNTSTDITPEATEAIIVTNPTPVFDGLDLEYVTDLSLGGDLPPNPDENLNVFSNISNYHNQAEEMVLRGELTEAIDYIEGILDDAPDNPDALFAKSRLYTYDYDEQNIAGETAQQLITLYPDSPWGYVALSDSFLNYPLFDEDDSAENALDALLQASDIAPENPHVAWRLARLSDWETKAEEFSQAEELGASGIDFIYAIGNYLNETDEMTRAIPYWESYLRNVDADFYQYKDSFWYLMEALIISGDPASAYDFLIESDLPETAMDAETLGNMAFIAYSADEFDDAQTWAESALSFSANANSAQFVQAYLLYWEEDESSEATKQLLELVEKDAYHRFIRYSVATDAYIASGRIMLDDGDEEEALRFYDLAITTNDNLPSLYEERADVYLELGDIKSARDDLELALQVATDPELQSYYQDRIIALGPSDSDK